MSIRPLLVSSSFIFTAGAILLIFFIILPGGVNHFPLNTFYWIEADTSSIPNAPSVARWTFYGYCDGSSGKNTDCTKAKAAYPFLPQDNFGTTSNIPHDFIEYSDTYYYLSRYSFASYLVTLFFDVVSFFLAFTSFGSRWGSLFASISVFISLIFGWASAATSTAVYVMARNKFISNGEHASLGVKLFAFTWTQAALQFLSFIGFCCSCCASKGRSNEVQEPVVGSGSSFRRHNRNVSAYSEKAIDEPVGKKRGFFSVKRSAPPTNSFFAENESQENALNTTSSYQRGA